MTNIHKLLAESPYEGSGGGLAPYSIPDKDIQKWVIGVVEGLFKKALIAQGDDDPFALSEGPWKNKLGVAIISLEEPKDKNFFTDGTETKKFNIRGTDVWVQCGVNSA